MWSGALWIVFVEKIEIKWCFMGVTGSEGMVHYGYLIRFGVKKVFLAKSDKNVLWVVGKRKSIVQIFRRAKPLGKAKS